MTVDVRLRPEAIANSGPAGVVELVFGPPVDGRYAILFLQADRVFLQFFRNGQGQFQTIDLLGSGLPLGTWAHFVMTLTLTASGAGSTVSASLTGAAAVTNRAIAANFPRLPGELSVGFSQLNGSTADWSVVLDDVSMNLGP